MSQIDPSLRIGSVELAVSDLGRSSDFYERVLGLPLIEQDEQSATLGTDSAHPALVLSAIAAPIAAPPRSSGLYHVAWLHPSRAALADTVRRIVGARGRFDGASDHGVSEALYLSDPDGLGIEIYVDRPREQWRRAADGHGVEMYTLPLDVDDLLKQGNDQPGETVAQGTGIGHVHLKVADVPRTAAFYRDALGFEDQAQLPSAAFVSAGGYHHHVGLNSWESRGGSPSPAGAPGLRLVEFELADEQALEHLERTLAENSGASGVSRGGQRRRDCERPRHTGLDVHCTVEIQTRVSPRRPRALPFNVSVPPQSSASAGPRRACSRQPRRPPAPLHRRAIPAADARAQLVCG